MSALNKPHTNKDEGCPKIITPTYDQHIESTKLNIFPYVTKENFERDATSVSIGLSSMGVLLGIFYFAYRICIENQRIRAERERGYCSSLLGMLDEYASILAPIFASTISSPKEVKAVESQVQHKFQQISHFLEAYEKRLKIAPLESRDFLLIFSLIDTSNLFSQKNPMNPKERADLQKMFFSRLKINRQICWNRLK